MDFNQNVMRFWTKWDIWVGGTLMFSIKIRFEIKARVQTSLDKYALPEIPLNAWGGNLGIGKKRPHAFGAMSHFWYETVLQGCIDSAIQQDLVCFLSLVDVYPVYDETPSLKLFLQVVWRNSGSSCRPQWWLNTSIASVVNEPQTQVQCYKE